MNPKITDWQSKRVWLVGASSGIGAAVARELAGRGARLALSARGREKLQALELADALLLPCDATDPQPGSCARTLVAAWGGVDLVVHLAGDYVPMRAENFDLAIAERVVEVNFNGAMRLAAIVLDDLCRRRHGLRAARRRLSRLAQGALLRAAGAQCPRS